jgi:hypothetical protein
MAISDMAKKPLSTINARMMAVSNQGKGCIGSVARRGASLPAQGDS